MQHPDFFLMQDQTFGRQEKLKSTRIITALFNKGKYLFSYPIKLIYLPADSISDIPAHQFGISVPKKKFKRAVDRNRIKRMVREAYRLNKGGIENLDPIVMMAIYVADSELSFKEIEFSIKKILNLLNKASSKG